MRLCIISLKKFSFHDDVYYTYGGFGDYVTSFLPYFDEIRLCVPVTTDRLPGAYPMSHPKLKFTSLPFYRNELELLLKWPAIFIGMAKAIKKADVVNPRIPDMTGVAGWLWCKLFRKPHFVSVQSDMHAFLEAPNNTKTRGVVRFGLYTWLRFYLLFERFIFRGSLCFPQGKVLYNRYPKATASYEWISSSIRKSDILSSAPYGRTTCKDSNIHLLHVGRITRAKGHLFLLKMLPLLIQQCPEKKITLTCIGKSDGILLKVLHQEAERLGITQQVLWLENVEHGEQLWSHFDAADLFILPSIWEGTPKVLLEAMARGVPVIASDVGGVSTLIEDGSRGLLVPAQDPHALAQAVKRMIKNENLRNHCIRNGLEFAHKHTIQAQTRFIMGKFEKHYPFLRL